MVVLDEYKMQLGALKETLALAHKQMNVDALTSECEKLEEQMGAADFWNDVCNQSKDRFSEKILRKLFVLDYAPNGMWCYLVSVYYLHNRDDEGNLDDEAFCRELNDVVMNLKPISQ